MRNFFLLGIIIFLVTGCKVGELTVEEKHKIELLSSEIEKLEQGILIASKNALDSTALIPSLIKARIEVDKLTISILRQHIASIESGLKPTITIQSILPNPELAASLEAEIKDADIALHKTRTEASLYGGGTIKSIITARAALEEVSLSSLRQKYLSAKYGLYIQPVKYETSKQNNAIIEENISPQENDSQQEAKVDDPGPFDFRRVRWGMSQDDVKTREGSKPTSFDKNHLKYKEKIESNNSSLIYLFDEDKLWRGVYILEEDFSNKNKYVDAYFAIVSSLKKKYGEPNSEQTVWSKDLYRNDFARRGLAYSVGDVASYAKWENDVSEIYASIDGNNYKINVKIYYSSKELEKSFRKKEEEQSNSKL